jgi:outer membrane lipoprotein
MRLPTAVLSSLVLGFSLAGCAGVISPELRGRAVPVESLRELRESPDRYRGSLVILGGEVIEVRNQAEGTSLVVLGRPVKGRERPDRLEEAGGRFIARFSEFLDPEVYARGRKVTIAGEVVGVEPERIGEAVYPYLVLEGREVYLWRESTRSYAYYPYDPWYHPWRDPFYDPFRSRRGMHFRGGAGLTIPID